MFPADCRAKSGYLKKLVTRPKFGYIDYSTAKKIVNNPANKLWTKPVDRSLGYTAKQEQELIEGYMNRNNMEV